MKTGNDPNSFGIIGLGRFGLSLAQELVKAGKDVVVLEIDPAKLESVKGLIEHVYPVDQINREILFESGVAHCGTVVVCIGKDIESNILATLNVIEAGVPRVIAKANSLDHGKVLEKIGAEVVYPETEMGARLAKSLISLKTVDFLELANDISITEIGVSSKFSGKTIAEINIRKKYRLNIIALTHEGKTTVNITPDLMLHAGDQVVVIGENSDIGVFGKANS
ncbi:MAG: TrkA family potassium uptake protein [Sphaerochaetaceae bacterium]